MLTEFLDNLTLQNIYLWVNYIVIPFWLLLILIPNSTFTKIFTNSIILPMILGSGYIFLFYQAIIQEEPFFDILKLYLGLDELYTIFSNERFLLLFWIHFVVINLFLGSWISRDAIRYGVSKKIVFFPLVMIYFAGPVGLVLYWFIRVFYAKKISLHD
jgi:hypothetical protein